MMYIKAFGFLNYRVFSGYIKEIEAKPESTGWGKKMPFGNCMAELSNSGGKKHSK